MMFMMRLKTLLSKAGFKDENCYVDILSEESMLVRFDDMDEYGAGDCEWFSVIVFDSFVPTVLGTDCVWKEELEAIVAVAERQHEEYYRKETNVAEQER